MNYKKKIENNIIETIVYNIESNKTISDIMGAFARLVMELKENNNQSEYMRMLKIYNDFNNKCKILHKEADHSRDNLVKFLNDKDEFRRKSFINEMSLQTGLVEKNDRELRNELRLMIKKEFNKPLPKATLQYLMHSIMFEPSINLFELFDIVGEWIKDMEKSNEDNDKLDKIRNSHEKFMELKNKRNHIIVYDVEPEKKYVETSISDKKEFARKTSILKQKIKEVSIIENQLKKEAMTLKGIIEEDKKYVIEKDFTIPEYNSGNVYDKNIKDVI